MVCESVIGISWKVFLRRCCSSLLTEASYMETLILTIVGVFGCLSLVRWSLDRALSTGAIEVVD